MERAVMEKVMWWYSASLIVAASLSPPSSDMSAMFHYVRNGDKCLFYSFIMRRFEIRYRFQITVESTVHKRLL